MSTDLKLNSEYERGALTPRRLDGGGGPMVVWRWGSWLWEWSLFAVTFAAIAVRGNSTMESAVFAARWFKGSAVKTSYER